MTATATAETIRPGDTITTQSGHSFTVQLKQLCLCIDNHYPGKVKHYTFKPRTGTGVVAAAHHEFPVQRAGGPVEVLRAHTATAEPIPCQPAYSVGYLFTGDDWASLPPETLLVDAWGAAYRIGWRFMDQSRRTVARYNTAGQGHPEVYDLDEAPAITADAQLRIVHLGR